MQRVGVAGRWIDILYAPIYETDDTRPSNRNIYDNFASFPCHSRGCYDATQFSLSVQCRSFIILHWLWSCQRFYYSLCSLCRYLIVINRIDVEIASAAHC